jgi:uncharacterized protein CbrC (UPF0167 family)
MSQYLITHSCGHNCTIQIYGTNTHGEREHKAAWLATRPCPDCLREQRTAGHEAASAAAAIWAASAGLPALDGTPKQVAWAETIRREVLDDLAADMGAAIRRHVADETEAADALAQVMAIYTRSAALVTTASTWIGRRPEGRLLIKEGLTEDDRAAINALSDRLRAAVAVAS